MPSLPVPVEPPFLKVCCIQNLEEAQLALELGANALGLVSAMPSGPGPIGEAEIAAIVRELDPRTSTFLLTSCRTSAEIVAQAARCGTSVLQLVDAVPADELRALRRALPSVTLVQVIHVAGEESIDEARAVAPLVDAVLLDSGRPNLPIAELGGTGRVHDWRVSVRIRAMLEEEFGRPLLLAGGLKPQNAAEAVQEVRPFGLDVCSGLRTEGRLDRTKLGAFVAAARSGSNR